MDQEQQRGWGAKVIDQLAQDLRLAFPDLTAFSVRNLKYMRAFAKAWPEAKFVQQVAAQIPWFHNCLLLDKVKDPTERKWYVRQTIKHGWSRNMLVHQVESGRYQRQGKAVTNFARPLPALQSELAQQVRQDPYPCDFLCLGTATQECGLLAHGQVFLLAAATATKKAPVK